MSVAPPLTFVRVRGADAAIFLNGQFTQSTLDMTRDESRAGAFCTPRGRALAVAFLVASENGFELWSHGSVIDALVATLTRYVLRADVRFETPDDRPASRLIELEIIGATLDLASPDFAAAAVAAGIPTIEEATVGEFVPQMINLDLVGGIDFTKGCYTGQEIVARTHNLGRIKRRMLPYALRGDRAPAAGAPVLAADGERIGRVVAAADGTVMAVVRLARRDDAVTADGVALGGLKPPPYLIPELDEHA